MRLQHLGVFVIITNRSRATNSIG